MPSQARADDARKRLLYLPDTTRNVHYVLMSPFLILTHNAQYVRICGMTTATTTDQYPADEAAEAAAATVVAAAAAVAAGPAAAASANGLSHNTCDALAHYA